MSDQRERVERELRLPRDALALIDETVERAREEFQDPGIDRQRVLELLIEHRLEELEREGGMEETQCSLSKSRPCDEGFEGVTFRWPSFGAVASVGRTALVLPYSSSLIKVSMRAATGISA